MTTPELTAEGGQSARIRRAIERARRELIDTSSRSRLLNTPLGSNRAKIIEIVGESADQVLDVLLKRRGTMSFAAIRPRQDEGLRLVLSDDNPDPVANQTDSILQTKLEHDRLQARLRSIETDAKTFEDEQGVNVLYLALGFLEWHEPGGDDRVRYAPLVLLPVSLERGSARSQFKIRYDGEEMGTNLPLQERLRTEGIALPELEDVEDLRPSSYCQRVTDQIAGRPEWRVHPNRMALGLFSFGRLMMFRDLDVGLWSAATNPAANPLIVSLFDEGFRDERSPVVEADEDIDAVVDIAAAGHGVEADSSQSVVIHEIQQGRHLIVQGPPGTGKSQTITNIIASAVRQGKKVLFVAEKMAALNVVRSNLSRVGLGTTCLELHSHKARKKEVLASLRETFEEDGTGRSDSDSLAADLRKSRAELNDYVKLVHKPLSPSALSPYSVFGALARLAGKGVAPPDFTIEDARTWEPPAVNERRKIVRRAAAHIELTNLPVDHPWRGVGLDAILPQDAQRFSGRAAEIASAFRAFMSEGRAVAARVTSGCETWKEAEGLFRLGQLLRRAPDCDASAIGHASWKAKRPAIQALIAAGESFARNRPELERVLREEAWKADVSAVRATISQHGGTLLRWLHAEYREAVRAFRGLCVNAVPAGASERLRLLDLLIESQQSKGFVKENAELGHQVFGSYWKDLASDWAHLRAIEMWEALSSDVPEGWRASASAIAPLREYGAVIAKLEHAGTSMWSSVEQLVAALRLDLGEAYGEPVLAAVGFEEIVSRFDGWSLNSDRLDEWIQWRAIRTGLYGAGLAELARRLADGRVGHAAATDVFEYAYLDCIARVVFESCPMLARFKGTAHEGAIEEFRSLDTQRIRMARQEVLAAHTSGMPRGNAGVGEIGQLAHQWNLLRPKLPLRKLIASAGRAMLAIKPVWMMSPMSLAQYVAQGTLTFDLVVMDEASQITPVDALGAIMRGSQLVVVGDEKQLPPTSFFDRMANADGAEDDADEPTDELTVTAGISDIESVLGLCAARGMPARMLRWHYRSKHESLIAISNQEFYKQLYIVPSASADDVGLRFHPVDGTYDRGRTRTNAAEAKAVAEAVMAHARRYREATPYPLGMSLGVAALSVAQRDRILDELELLRRGSPELESFFGHETTEPFFVKNLESIQGDERDVIFISIAYGPDDEGYRTMFFGPVSQNGGERRLNVLISRARRRCEVFSSIRSADIDLARAPSTGARVLKAFLAYAETGKLDRSVLSATPQGSDFEDDVAQALAAAGFAVEQQVGVNGFFLDLAIKNPERPGSYLIGIECDGASYHSSRSARDRDRIREMVLRDRGWRIHRIWSTDWFRARDRELKRAIAAINAARVTAPAGPVPEREPLPAEVVPMIERTVPRQRKVLYREASFTVADSHEPHRMPLAKRIDAIRKIVAIEGPVHGAEVARRFAAICGKNRAGGRIDAAVQEALRHGVRQHHFRLDGDFVLGPDQETIGPRDRSSVSSLNLRKPECLPPTEIKNGVIQVVREHLGVTRDEVADAVAGLFGFQRVTEGIGSAIEVQLRALLSSGVLRIEGDKVYPCDEPKSRV